MPYWSNFNASLGYGLLIWGDDPMKSLPKLGYVKPDEYPWKFGYVRPEVSVETSGFRSAINLDVDLSPVSLFIVSVGKTFEHRASNGRLDFDCSTNSCYGTLEKTRFTYGGLPFGFGPVFFGGFSQTEWVNSQSEEKAGFVDQLTSLVGNADKDTLKRDVLLGGVILSQNIMLAGGVSEEKYRKSKDQSQVTFSSVSITNAPFEINLIVGERDRKFEDKDEFWGLLNIRWIGKRAMGQ